MVKKILVALDFTEVSINALRYALNCFPERSIEVLYIKSDPELKRMVEKPGNEHLFEFWRNAIVQFITKELKIEQLPKNITVLTSFGSLIKTLIKKLEEPGIQCLFMGTRDKYNFFDRWMGTTSYNTVLKATKPVYLIPKYATYKSFKTVMVASDIPLVNKALISKLNTWNEKHRAYVKFLHIQPDYQLDIKDLNKTIVEELFEKGNPPYGFEIATLKNNHISEALLGSAYNFNADLLLIFPQKKSFIDDLFDRSVSQELILKSEIPLLFLK